MKIARFIREIETRKPTDPADLPFVTQYLFKVTPPMVWSDGVIYRNDRVIREEGRGMRNAMRRLRFDRKTGAEIKPGSIFNQKPDPKYHYSYKERSTAFVIASASDLKTYMEAVNQRIVEKAKTTKAYYESHPVKDEHTAKHLREADETIRLFSQSMPFQPEVYLFACDKSGKWKSSSELPGSCRDTLDHRDPFTNVGYTVVGMPRKLELEVVKEEEQHELL